jgi:hypothetical protein
MSRPIKFFDPTEETIKGAGKLPHWQQAGACYFITFRLADSIPSELMEKWKKDRDAWIRIIRRLGLRKQRMNITACSP